MLTIPTLDKLRGLKLYGMSKAFEEQLSSSDYESLNFEERFGFLVDQETIERENRGLTARIKRAKFRQSACMEDIEYSSSRGMDKSLIMSFKTCKWIKDYLNILITGPCGAGKSYLACALGHRACLQGYKVLNFRAPRLFPDIAIAHGDGRYSKLMSSIAKTDLLIIDDWGLSVLNDQEQRDLLEILEDRHGVHSTIITSQLPVEKWHEMIGNPTLADAILDRLVHNAYRINLKGGSIRKEKSKLSKKEKGL